MFLSIWMDTKKEEQSLLQLDLRLWGKGENRCSGDC